MTRDQFIQQAYLMAVGKAVAPAQGTNKWNVLLGTANIFIEQWQNEPNTDWLSLRDTTTVSPITATDSFTIDTDLIRKLSPLEDDKVVITTTDGKTAEYSIVKPSQLSKYDQCVAKVGDQLVFNKAFGSDSEFIGGTITIPYFGYAASLTDANSEVPVDQPLWLVYMVAAEFVRNNDYIKQNQYPNLINLANEVMKSMKKNNGETHLSFVNRGEWTPLSETF